MLFQVAGADQQGIVTVEAVKKWRKIHFNLITVDPINPQTGEISDEDLIIISGNGKGKPCRLYVRDDMQELVFLRKNLMNKDGKANNVSKLPYRK